MTTTARDIVKSALRKIAVLGQGASLNNQEAQDGLSALNMMVASWSVEGNLVFTQQFETFNIVNGQKAYTVGTGGDFNTDRVLRISSAYTTQGTQDYLLTRYNKDEYAAIYDKDTLGIPSIYYFDANYPLANLTLYPVPVGVQKITLVDENALTGFASLDTVFAMPAEYEEALIYNLAIRLAPEYEREALPSVVKIAAKSKKIVESQNSRNNTSASTIQVPSSGRTTGNVYRGYPR
jgi:hypothetical protein